jgi:NADPH2:quinone reductase
MTRGARYPTRAVRIHRTGGPEVMRLDEIELEAPGPGEALVRNAAIGLNFIDTHHRAGRYPLPPLPATLGMEGAGTIEALGAGVADLAVGDRVAYVIGGHGAVPGAYADLARLPAGQLVRIPPEIGYETAAAMILKGLTAQYLLRGAYPVAPGETILVHAAAGGVGLLLCQWATHLGARVIGTVGSSEKAALAAEHGCDHVVDYSAEDVAARVRALTAGEGVPVVYDAVGASTFETSLRCLRVRGTLVSYGTASGPIPPFDVFRLNVMGSLYLTSAGLAWYTRSRPELLTRSAELLDVVVRGKVKVPVRQRWRLEEAADAHRALEGRATSGMSVILP